VSRRAYLDWLRGIAVLIMIEAHTLDSWTHTADRTRAAYKWAIVVGGFGAPTFLFLAGIALALAAGSRLRKGLSDADVAAMARRRGWQIFGLALLFRLQSAVLGGGGLQSLLKVDILNVMGLSMLVTAGLWRVSVHASQRAVILASAAAAAAMLTPIIRATRRLDWLPDPIEAYVRPIPMLTGFTLFPWAGFVLAGGVIGLWLDSARTPRDERRVIILLTWLGPALAMAGYAAALLPPIYAETSFWTSSPTFFLVRLGVLTTAIPIAYAWTSVVRGRSLLQEMGIASLFVYWIHVEMVYGILSSPLHRRLTFEQALVAFAVFSACLYGLVKLKDRVGGHLGPFAKGSPVTVEADVPGPARKSGKG
jgi:uncharacterized membrane protein